MDDAAVHHVFPGGWIWILRFNNGLTSAGAALTDSTAAAIGAADGAAAWQRLLDRLPSVRDQFRRGARDAAVRARAAAVVPQRAGRGTDVGAAAVGGRRDRPAAVDRISADAARHPCACSMLLERTSPGPDRDAALAAYERTTLGGARRDGTAGRRALRDDGRSAAVQAARLLYFAAASFSEAARRLGRPALAPGFLLSSIRRSGPRLAACAALAASASTRPEPAARSSARIDRAIEPFDIAGLLDRSRRDWYPVLADDLVASAAKLDATPGEIHRLHRNRCGVSTAGGDHERTSGAWLTRRGSCAIRPGSSAIREKLDQIIQNQREIKGNQRVILANQRKLDQVLRNQTRIEGTRKRSSQISGGSSAK